MEYTPHISDLRNRMILCQLLVSKFDYGDTAEAKELCTRIGRLLDEGEIECASGLLWRLEQQIRALEASANSEIAAATRLLRERWKVSS